MKLQNAQKIILLLAFALLNVSLSYAKAEEIGLAVSKNTFDLEILAGDSYTGDLAVFNTSKKVALPVNIQLSLWDLKEDSDDIEFMESEPALNAAKWFEINPTKMILEPDGFQEINFTIKAPEDVSPGTYLVMMRFQAVLPEHYFEEEGPRFIPELGVLFFIKISLLNLERVENPYQAEIASVEPKDASHIKLLENIINPAKANVLENAVKTLTAKIKNTGVYHFKASGFVEIKNLFGQTAARADLENRYLLPDRYRKIDIKVFPPLPEKTDSYITNLWNSISYALKENSYLGPYNAILTLNIPNEPPVVYQTNFWVMPWKIIAAIVFVLALAVFFVKRIKLAAKMLTKN